MGQAKVMTTGRVKDSQTRVQDWILQHDTYVALGVQILLVHLRLACCCWFLVLIEHVHHISFKPCMLPRLGSESGVMGRCYGSCQFDRCHT